ncbi:hypothetical protein BH11BAC7_BH11BAC7_16750 [soil metagenome]
MSLLLFVFVAATAQSQICSYVQIRRIAIDPTKVAGSIDLTDFPVLINITSDNDLRTVANGGRVQNASGWDIIFTADDGVTLLNHQLEKYVPLTGEYIANVKVPLLSTSITTYIYMYYGNASIVADPSSTATWDANYKGVYHFQNDFLDKTSNGNNGTNNGSTFATGKIADGIFLDNSTTTDKVTVNTTGMNSNSGTVELWGQAASFLATETYFYGCTTQPAYANRIQIYAFNGQLRIGMGNSHAIGGDLFALTAGTWYHIAVKWAGAGGNGTFWVYINGAQIYTNNYSAFPAIQTFAEIGNDGDPVTSMQALRGYIDEVRTSNITRSADWITTSYNSQSSPATFYSFSPTFTRWIGGTSTNWAIGSNWSPAGVPAANADLLITNGTNQPTLDMNRQIGDIWIQSGATVSISTFNLSFRYNVINCGTLTASTGTLTANSVATYMQQQHFSGTGTFNLNKLTVNNTFSPTPSLRLLKNVSVSGAFTLTSGIVYTTAVNILVLSSTATATSGLATSFVDGPMTKAGTAAFVFPVGNGTKWARIGIGSTLSATTFYAQYFASAYSNTVFMASSPTPVLNNVSTVEHWILNRTAGTGTAIVTLYWEDAAWSGINNCTNTDLRVAHWCASCNSGGGLWENNNNAVSTTGTCSGASAGTVSTTLAVTSFSPFTFGSLSSSVNPLPVELLYFNAACDAGKVNVTWATASETNNDYFTVERTADGINYETVGIVNGAGNSTQELHYSFIDEAPIAGIFYYRLKQTDFNGQTEAFDFVTVSCDDDLSAVTIFPNPNNGSFTINGIAPGNDVYITNALGEIIFETKAYAVKTEIDLSAQAKGIYFVHVVTEQATVVEKVVVGD